MLYFSVFINPSYIKTGGAGGEGWGGGLERQSEREREKHVYVLRNQYNNGLHRIRFFIMPPPPPPPVLCLALGKQELDSGRGRTNAANRLFLKGVGLFGCFFLSFFFSFSFASFLFLPFFFLFLFSLQIYSFEGQSVTCFFFVDAILFPLSPTHA